MPPKHIQHALACCMLLLVASLAAAAAAAHANADPAHRPPTTTTASTNGYTLKAEADRVSFLPGGPAQLDFGLFAGYITVDEAAGRSLFYVFAEARAKQPTEAPLLLWLNGGPGCSSLGGGFMSELGPFFPTANGQTLQPNPYSWNNLTNVLWLESPAFVGFSYSNSTEDQIVGDARTAADARLFLLHWMKRFPQFAKSDLYLSGESYGGHYVPNLALEIVRGNKRTPSAAGSSDGSDTINRGSDNSDRSVASSVSSSSSDSDVERAGVGSASDRGVSPGKGFLNLKGFFVGNAWTDAALDNRGALDFWYSHAMISAEAHNAISENCDFSVIGPLLRGSEALTLPGTHTTTASSSSVGVDNIKSLWRGMAAAVSAKAQRAVATMLPSFSSSTLSSAFSSPASSVSGGSLPREQQLSDRDLICARWLDIAQSELGNINIYEIYADVCVRPAPSAALRASATTPAASASVKTYRGALLGHVHPRSRGGGAAAADTGAHSVVDGGGGDGLDASSISLSRLPKKPRYDPCIDGEVETYFNLPAVQAALHANQTVKLPWRWTDCTSLISYSREDLLSSMLPAYKELLAAEPALKIWVFSGDVDGIVPVLGSRRWIESLGLPVSKAWRAWTSRTGQVGGWRIDYEGLTFATVRNSGHMVPYVTPERAFHLLGEFLFEGDDGRHGGSAVRQESSRDSSRVAVA